MATARDNLARKQIYIPVTQLEEEVVLRVAAYCRVSTDSDDQLNSFAAQNAHYNNLIKFHDRWELVDIYADEGITGTSTKKRDDFNRMIRRCKAKKIDLILTKSISRFARNTLDTINYTRMLRAMGIGVIFEKENINTLDMDSEVLITMLGAFAQAESESISRNVAWGKRQAIREGKVPVNFKRLYGYFLQDDGTPGIEPEKGEVVRRIFDQYRKGDSLRMIRDQLIADGISGPTEGRQWQISTIKGILTNEKYCGDALGQKTFKENLIGGKTVKNTGQLPQVLVQNNHPGIVSRDVFYTVREEMKRGKKPLGQGIHRKNQLHQQIRPFGAACVRGMRHPVPKVYMEYQRETADCLALCQPIRLWQKKSP